MTGTPLDDVFDLIGLSDLLDSVPDTPGAFFFLLGMLVAFALARELPGVLFSILLRVKRARLVQRPLGTRLEKIANLFPRTSREDLVDLLNSERTEEYDALMKGDRWTARFIRVRVVILFVHRAGDGAVAAIAARLLQTGQ